jgi:shikimate dehydrogenase
MHNAALEAMGLAGAWRYEAIEAGPESFEALVRGMPEQGFAGANVTVPHKGAALAVADELSGEAREIGAANTLVFSGGQIRAENTDAAGLIASLPGSPEGSRALVLGAGGAARAAVWALVREGAEVSVWNRTALRARHLCEDLGAVPEERPQPGDFGLIVNATSVGLAGEDPFEELPLNPEGFRSGQTVVDLVYGGEPSAMNQAAAAAGAASVDGIEVLVRQGAISLALWTGSEPPLDVMREAARGG